MNKEIIINSLKHINVAILTRDKWLAVGMALKHEGFPCSVWDEWSKNDSRYHEGECQKLWDGFHGSSNPVTGASIIQMAKDFGFYPNDLNDVPLQWDSSIDQDGIAEIEHDTNILKPTQQLIKYLTALHNPHDIVGYVTNDVFLNPDGAYKPKQGVFCRTVEEIINSLKKHPDNINETIGDFKPEAGAWIRVNPLDGQGVRDKNVSKFKYVLVESDELSVKEQEILFKKLNLPIAAMVYSGSKSIHALVHIDADDYAEYRTRVQFLYDYLDKQGVSIDKQNRNPARLSRMPGVTRNGKMQTLLATNIGKKSWDEWYESISNTSNKLPEIISLADSKDNPPILPEELICGILRKGHKMIISGSSKVGKSFLLMELCIAIASGDEWIGFKCTQGKVLYINLEIDSESCKQRFLEICKELNTDPKYMDNIKIWNLRGYARPLNELLPELLQRVDEENYSAIILDPIYKIITGDENSATDMGTFCNYIDKICTTTKSSVIYCHHHSKGVQGFKKAQDRSSGSGVFARDPDAILDIIELELSDDMKNCFGKNAIILRMESSLREFPNITPVNFQFKYPIHIVDTLGTFDSLPTQGSFEAASVKAQNANNKKRENAEESFRTAYNSLNIDGKGARVQELSNFLNVGKQTIYNRVRSMSAEFEVNDGVVARVK